MSDEPTIHNINNTTIETQNNHSVTTITNHGKSDIQIVTSTPVINKTVLAKPDNPASANDQLQIREELERVVDLKKINIPKYIQENKELREKEISKLFRYTRSALNQHLGVNSNKEYTKDMVSEAISYLKFQQKKLKNNKVVQDKDPKIMDENITAIKAKLGQLKRENPQDCIQEKYDSYLKKIYGVTSLNDMTKNQVQELYRYMMQNPKFSTARNDEKSAFDQRLECLKEAVGMLKAMYGDFQNQDGWGDPIPLDSKVVGFDRNNVAALLREKFPNAFPNNMGEETFKSFWTKQKIIKYKQGNRMQTDRKTKP